MNLKPQDKLGRQIRDLRISVTDRCNFRCTYCMPKEVFNSKYQFMARSELLTFEEIVHIAEIFVGLGVEKLRLTGGEPLIRRNIEKLVEKLVRVVGVKDIGLTTNGSLLTLEKARALKESGLKRITVSLDSLNDLVFQTLSDTNFPVSQVLQGIDNASQAGLQVKINMVVKRGVNDNDILPMARKFHHSGHTLRFIEYMDVGNSNDWNIDAVVPTQEIVSLINAAMPLQAIAENYSGEVARRWRYCDGGGEVGFISSVTQPFCRDCTRMRISAEGKLYTCLFATQGYDIRSLLRHGSADELIAEQLITLWKKREDRYSEIRSTHTSVLQKVEMSYVGG